MLRFVALLAHAAIGAQAASTRSERHSGTAQQYRTKVFDAVVARSMSISIREYPENVGTTGVVNLRGESPTHFDTLGIPVLPRKDFAVVSAAAIRQAYLRRAIAHHPHKVLFAAMNDDRHDTGNGFPPTNATACELWGKRECLRWRNRDSTITLAYPDVPARRSSAEHLFATKALRCIATALIPHCR